MTRSVASARCCLARTTASLVSAVSCRVTKATYSAYAVFFTGLWSTRSNAAAHATSASSLGHGRVTPVRTSSAVASGSFRAADICSAAAARSRGTPPSARCTSARMASRRSRSST
nr:hypothetical protein [Human alphaherpesvirus 2]QBH76272.1 hypothetical protein [Human alphaherpesvirus 2]QBH76542.1 hypothetical protein [Human alphaherpesvirus 2]QBH76629.1 hypothetical protein [Human alphaherpesvirus 2]QBH78625.1 hypothetical protein [Human alphaherpesvirus 2]